MCCTPSRNNKRHLPGRATRLSVSPRWPARANAGKTASALRIADLKSTDSTCSSSSATWNDVRFELKHRARMGAEESLRSGARSAISDFSFFALSPIALKLYTLSASLLAAY